jgi:hypothetical protein
VRVATTRTTVAGLLIASVASGTIAPITLAAPVPAASAKAEKELAAVAAKLHGSWRGGACEGEITFRENRTYEWTGIGPGGERHEGTWTLRGDPARPALVMECKKADDPEREGKTTELKIVGVDDDQFEFKYSDTTKSRTFERAKKKSSEPRSPSGDPK